MTRRLLCRRGDVEPSVTRITRAVWLPALPYRAASAALKCHWVKTPCLPCCPGHAASFATTSHLAACTSTEYPTFTEYPGVSLLTVLPLPLHIILGTGRTCGQRWCPTLLGLKPDILECHGVPVSTRQHDDGCAQ